MSKIHAWAAHGPGQPLVPYEYEAGTLGPEEVEIAVESCGLCHSDLSIRNNDWGISTYPCIPGHEVIGRVVALGEHAKGLTIGQHVGLGWSAQSCLHCHECLSGNHHLCSQVVPTIVGHYGGFAERVHAQWTWAIPLPDALDTSAAGPLLCGGITVLSPFLTHDIKPTQRVGVVGIGGLGHLALKFATAWGCEVTALTSSESKYEEARSFGAHRVLSSRNSEEIRALAGALDHVIVAVNVPLDWSALIATLAPQGQLHIVGAVLEAIPVAAFDLINGQRSVSGSPTGSPVAIADMLNFAARHHIVPLVEHFKMSDVNEAFARLESGKAHYRIVLDADFGSTGIVPTDRRKILG
ncbi:NADPH-dependent aldehyde reductase Ahr [Ktedonobacter robiniae]|nr:NAD(P)-dependent alcohol dehydrogenase [Ktedonobacter robiniae]